LASFPPAEPLPAQAAISELAFLEAGRLGLALPRFAVKWADTRRRRIHTGEMWRYPDGRFEVFFDSYASPDDLFWCALHEARHLADFADPAFRHLSRLEMERRAVNFVARARGFR
jgi:hypothetical protein